MTEKEAIEKLKLEGGIEFSGKPRRVAEFIEALDMAIMALEKQIPKKPKEYKGYAGKCLCGVVFLDKSTKYCGNCGQALDWSENPKE